MAIPNRAPSIVWQLRNVSLSGYVRTDINDTIEISMPWIANPLERDHIWLTRKDARLLAKRINQCLDSTRRK